MTTNVTISTNYIHPGKKLRVRTVNPNDGAVYNEQSVSQADIDEKGVAGEHGVKTLTLETKYVHDSARLVIDEAE